MIDYAETYAARGWRVLPLYWFDETLGRCACGREGCTSPVKHPIGQLVPHGLTDATSEITVLRRWWAMYPKANIGIATGADSGLVVLDIDPRHGGNEAARDLVKRHGNFTKTLQSRTGSGGLHLIYRHPGIVVRNSAGALGAGLDVRGDGGYIVAPPSNHASGGVYTWADPDTPLADLPAWMMRGTTNAETNHAARTTPETIPHGTQHYTLVSIAGTMRKRGCTESEIAALLHEMNKRCEQPASPRNIDKIAESVAGYAPDEVLGVVLDEVTRATDPSASRRFYSLAEILTEQVARIEELRANGGTLPGITTGFARLDDMTMGLQKSELIVLAARPSMGKTAMATSMAQSAAAHEVVVVIFSVEMARGPLGDRFLATTTGIESVQLRSGRLTDEEMRKTHIAVSVLSDMPIYICDESAITTRSMQAICEALPTPPGIIFVDYLQLVRAQGRYNREDEAISEVSIGLKGLAKTFECPVVALAQLNRNVEHRSSKRPALADLRGSGQIEQDADVVMFIHRPEVYGETHIDLGARSLVAEGLAEIIVSKQRNGPIGSIVLRFDAKTTRFEDYDYNTLNVGSHNGTGARNEKVPF